MRRVEIELGVRLVNLLHAWTCLAILWYVVEKIT